MQDHTRVPLIDGFGRAVRDLRISVTDRCNFRCRYCMPAEGLAWLPRTDLLTFEEIVRLTAILVDSGVTSLKLTGGEPLVRRDLARLVAMLRSLAPTLDISLTTNGFLLKEHAAELAAAGLTRVTVSCDSLIRHRFEDMTLRDALTEVMEGLEASAAAGLTPVKINSVVIKGVNDDESLSFARLARRTGFEVRFIEYMPLDAQDEWDSSAVIPARTLIGEIHESFPLSPQEHSDGPATVFTFADGSPGRLAIIPSVTEPFCASCDRARITADGRMRACLFSLEETDLITPMRTGADDDELAAHMQRCIAGKWAGHSIGREGFVKPARSMSMIGG
ncbi:MAG TPA: GTP 3',8-cyclase MoaA [Actinomycetota bacterium]|nr:GTP 3',8-cyclase MoaA [Actinomycetota bacterium]